MEWFTETAWPPIFICLAAAALSLLVWGNGRRRVMLFVAIVFIVACPILYAYERYHVTEPERVEAKIPELAAAVEADDVNKVLTFFAEDNRGDRLAVESGMKLVRIEGPIRITDVRVRFNDDRTAIFSHFRANADAVLKSNGAKRRFPTRWELTWKQTGGDWRITRLKRLDPVRDDDEEIDILSRE